MSDPKPPSASVCHMNELVLPNDTNTLGNLMGGEALDDLFEELDEDGDGSVSRAELETWWEREVAPNQAINRRAAALEQFRAEAAAWSEELTGAEVFARLYSDGSGTLDMEEVERLAAALGVVLSSTGTAEMFGEMDSDGNGQVDLEEFERWWSAHYEET